MTRVWGQRGEGGLSGASSVGSPGTPRDAQNAYQKKEMELADERERYQRLTAETKVLRGNLSRLQRVMEEATLEAVRRDQEKNDLQRSVAESDRAVVEQKAHLSRLEHEVETLREALHRRKERTP